MTRLLISELFERAIGGLLKTSQLLFFAYADFEEERMKYENVKKIYDRYLALEECDPTLVSFFLLPSCSGQTFFKESCCLRQQLSSEHFLYMALWFPFADNLI